MVHQGRAGLDDHVAAGLQGLPLGQIHRRGLAAVDHRQRASHLEGLRHVLFGHVKSLSAPCSSLALQQFEHGADDVGLGLAFRLGEGAVLRARVAAGRGGPLAQAVVSLDRQ